MVLGFLVTPNETFNDIILEIVKGGQWSTDLGFQWLMEIFRERGGWWQIMLLSCCFFWGESNKSKLDIKLLNLNIYLTLVLSALK